MCLVQFLMSTIDFIWIISKLPHPLNIIFFSSHFFHSCFILGIVATMDVDLDKRTKVSRACDYCKKRKFKCSGVSPCELCTKRESNVSLVLLIDVQYDARIRKEQYEINPQLQQAQLPAKSKRMRIKLIKLH